MDWSVIQDFFLRQLLTIRLQFPIISSNNIALPNQSFNPENKNFWIEYAINPGEIIWETETQKKAYAVINYVLNVKQNVGTDRVYNLASHIANLFILRNGMKWDVSYGGYQIYLETLETLPGIVVNDVFKMNVRLTVCIYNI